MLQMPTLCLLAPWGVVRLVLCTFLLFAPGVGRAADWFVDAAAPEGGDGSVASPFSRIADATGVARPGDRVLLAPGSYTHTVRLDVNGVQRRALLVLPAGVQVLGSGRNRTFLVAPAGGTTLVFGLTAAGVDRTSRASDLSIHGPCFQGINLRNASPVLERIDVTSDAVGSSSVAFDARDGSEPLCRELRLDGGHSALFIEFGSGGRYEDCIIARRLNEGIALSDADPVLLGCVIEGQGRDTLVLNQDSRPTFRDCRFGRGERWTVRVTPVNQPGVVDLSGNSWFSTDPAEIRASILDASVDPSLGVSIEIEPLRDPVAVEPLSVGQWKLRYVSPSSANQGQ